MLCTAGVVPISEAVLAHHVSSGGQVDIARYGRVRLWGSVGFIAAVTAGGFVLEAGGCRALSAALHRRARGPARSPPSGCRRRASRRMPSRWSRAPWRCLREPVVAWFFAGTFLTVLAHTSLYAFYSLYLASLGYGQGAIGLLWAVGVAVEVAWFAFQGRWVNRLPVHGWLALAAAVSALRFAAIAAFAGHAAVLIVAQLPARDYLRRPALGLHRRDLPPFPGAPAQPRPGALHRARLRRLRACSAASPAGALSERLGFAAVFWAASAVSLVAVLSCWRALVLDRARA